MRRHTGFFITAAILALLIALNFGAYFSGTAAQAEESGQFIKWVDFNIPYTALEKALQLDIEAHNRGESIDWVDLLACVAAQNGNNWKGYRHSDLESIARRLQEGETLETITDNLSYFDYYREAYGAVLDNFVGEYQIGTGEVDAAGQPVLETRYGLKAYSPIGHGYAFEHYKDFGNSRTYGFTRKHLGNDLMGQIGTPIMAVESGIIEHLGWNQYGGWRIGIRSLDKKRYYYYAHLRKDAPYAEGLEEGMLVQAGDLIGYLGMTGYSQKENVNNMQTPHLHFGMQLIFDPSQEEGGQEIWIDVYPLVELLYRHHTSPVVTDPENPNAFLRKYAFCDPVVTQYLAQGEQKEETTVEESSCLTVEESSPAR